MNKILLLSVLLLVSLFSFNFNVSAAGIVDLVSVTSVTADPSSTATVTFNINNTGNAAIATVTLVSSALTRVGGVETISAPNIASITNLGIGANLNQQFTVSVGALLAGTYSGTLTATDASDPTNKDSLPYTVTINSKSILSVPTAVSDKLTISSQPDKSRTKVFTIKNDGSVTLTPTVTTSTNFTDNDGDQITFSFSPVTLSAIAPGATQDVTLTTNVPNDMDIGTYTGTLTLTATSVTKVITLEIRVDPEICKDGRVSNSNPINSASDGNLRVDMSDPDNGDDFSPGSKIRVSVSVDNNKDEDMDVIVEAKLYNIDKNNEIASVESDSTTIDKNDNQDFDLDLEVPVSDSDLKESDNFVLFVRAYEDGNEDENCNYDNVDLDFKRETNDVAITRVTMNPPILSCSDTANFAVEVQNVGKKDQDSVQVTLKETELGLQQSSEVFSLQKFDKSGDTALKTFTYKIPANSKEGDYFVETKIFFSTKSVSRLDKITVTKCQAVSSADVLTLPQTSFTALQGKVFTVPLTLKNSGSQTATYTVDVRVENGWADVSAEQKVSVSAGEQTTVYAYLTPRSSLTAGTYTAAIDVKQDNQLLKTSQVTVNVGSDNQVTGGSTYQPSITLSSVWRNLAQSTAFWITAVVIIFALVIYVLSALLRPR